MFVHMQACMHAHVHITVCIDILIIYIIIIIHTNARHIYNVHVHVYIHTGTDLPAYIRDTVQTLDLTNMCVYTILHAQLTCAPHAYFASQVT